MRRSNFLKMAGCLAVAAAIGGIKLQSPLERWIADYAISSQFIDGKITLEARADLESLQALASICDSPLQASGNQLTGHFAEGEIAVRLI